MSAAFGSGCTEEERASIEPQPDTEPNQETEPEVWAEPEVESEPAGQEEIANISVEVPDSENLTKEEGAILAEPIRVVVEVFDYPTSGEERRFF